MKYSLAGSASLLLQLGAAMQFTNSSSSSTVPSTSSGTGVGTTSFLTSTVKPTVTVPGVTTITEVVDEVVTYCPAPTVLTLGPNKVYTVTAPGTVTIKDCPCTLKKAVSTEVVTAYTTYCPAPTTIVQGTQTYTVTAPGVATITNCPCTLTHPITAPAAPTSPAQAPAAPPAPVAPAPAGSCPACPSCPAATTVTVTVGANGVPVAPAPSGPAPAPSGPAPSGPAAPAPTGPAPTGPAPGTTVVVPPVSPAPPTVVVPPTPKNTTTPSGKTCPLTLAGAEYQYPHLIVESTPSGRYSATSYNASVAPGKIASFNFDIPASYAGKTCDVVFALPTQAQLETSSFTLLGAGQLQFASLSTPAVAGGLSSNTTSTPLGSWTVAPGAAFKAASGACKAGATVGYSITALGVELNYFQDYNPCPIGLYVVAH